MILTILEKSMYKHSGRENFTLKIDSHDTGKILKEKIAQVKGISVDSQKLLYKGRSIDNDKDLAEYLILNGSSIYLVLKLGEPKPSEIKAAMTAVVTNTVDCQAPYYRLMHLIHTERTEGLNLEGRCINSQCLAYNHPGIRNKWFDEYDTVLDRNEEKCLLCEECIQIERYVLKDCHYTYSGIMSQGDGLEPKKVTMQKEIIVRNNEQEFYPEVAGHGTWLSLKIVTKKMNPNYRGELWCSICTSELYIGQKVLECGHVFHRRCLEKIEALGIRCVLCHL